MILDFILPFGYVVFFLWLISSKYFLRVYGISPRILQAVFVLKLAAAFSLVLIYTYYYTDKKYADVYKYFNDSRVLFETIFTNPLHFFEMLTGINGNASHLSGYYNEMQNWFDRFSIINTDRTMIRIHTLFWFLSAGNIYVHAVLFCFLSFIGTAALVKVISAELPAKSSDVFLIFFLLPSVLFWTSAPLKEALVIFSSGMSFLFLYRLQLRKAKARRIVFLVLSLFLLLYSDLTSFLVMLPAFAAWHWSKRTGTNPFPKFIVTAAVALAAVFALQMAGKKYHIPSMIAGRHNEFVDLARSVKAGSTFDSRKFDPTWSEIISEIPEAWKNVLTRPHIYELRNPLMIISFAENVFLFLIILFYLANAFRKKPELMPVLYFAVFYVFVMLLLIGLVTPVTGAIVRYRAPVLPYLMLIFLMLSSRPLIKKFL